MKRSRNKLYSAAVIFLIVIGAAAVAAPLIAPYSPTDQDTDIRFSAPSADHPLGTDNFGRDVLSRIIFGSRPALIVGIVSVGVAVLIGTAVGLAAGLGGNKADNILMLLMDSILSFPTILLAITSRLLSRIRDRTGHAGDRRHLQPRFRKAGPGRDPSHKD